MLPYAYEITKYDPADRDGKGRYTGGQDRVSDHGPPEAAYLRVVADFATETGVRQLAIREPQVTAFVHFGLEPPISGHGLAGLFPPDLAGYHDGAVVPVAVAVELVRAMLRENGAWCRLEAEDQLTVMLLCLSRGRGDLSGLRFLSHWGGVPTGLLLVADKTGMGRSGWSAQALIRSRPAGQGG